MVQISTQNPIELRMPPQNVEAEMSALGSLMLDRDAIFKVADFLKPLDFYKSAHREIYEAMLDIFSHREPIDVLSVTARLREKGRMEEVGGSAYITSLVNVVPTATHVAHYASIVRRKRLLRDLIEASSYIAQLGYKEAEDVDVLIDEAEQRIFGISRDSLRQEFLVIKDALEEAWERIEKIHNNRDALRGVTTGSKEQLVDRLIASEAAVDLRRLRTGHLNQQGNGDDFSRLQSAMSILSELPLYLDDTPSPTVMELRAKARRLQSEKKLELVIVDYLQLIKGYGSPESRVQEVSEISRSLKAMAKELNVPV